MSDYKKTRAKRAHTHSTFARRINTVFNRNAFSYTTNFGWFKLRLEHIDFLENEIPFFSVTGHALRDKIAAC